MIDIEEQIKCVEREIGMRERVYPDKLKAEELLKDVYINWCKVNAVAGENRNLEADKRCAMELNTFLRWNMVGVKTR